MQDFLTFNFAVRRGQAGGAHEQRGEIQVRLGEGLPVGTNILRYSVRLGEDLSESIIIYN